MPTISNRNDVEQAIREYRLALQLDPRHFWARFRLGRCLLAPMRTTKLLKC
jgi:hypothetical protein